MFVKFTGSIRDFFVFMLTHNIFTESYQTGLGDMLNFNFSEKGLWLASTLYFVYDFSRKMFLILDSINRPNFIVWLPFLLEIFGNMCITILLTRFDVIEFEIKLIFLIKLFCYVTKTSKQKLKYFENKSRFWGEIKSIFYDFLRAFSC